MSNISILAVGDELLIGKITNTNASYIAKKLNSLSKIVTRQAVCADDEKEIILSLDYLLSASDICIVTGGLGITADDITKQLVAKYCGLPLIKSNEAEKEVLKYYETRGICDTEKYKGFFEVIQGSVLLKNETGVALGMFVNYRNKQLVLLPGPPCEMIPMFEKCLLPILFKDEEKQVETEFFKILGVRELDVVNRVKDLNVYEEVGIVLTTYCSICEVSLVLRYISGKNCDIISKIKREILLRFKDELFTTSNLEIEEEVYELLKQTNKSISTAESMTGGLIASKLINVPGISKYLAEGVVTYSSVSKSNRLNISVETIEKYGEVSREIAFEMCSGLFKTSSCDIAVATTGIAGPCGDGRESEVGKCFIAVGTKDNIRVFSHRFFGNRENIRESAAKTALFYVIKLLKSFTDGGNNGY